jgi:hypothetical protein
MILTMNNDTLRKTLRKLKGANISRAKMEKLYALMLFRSGIIFTGKGKTIAVAGDCFARWCKRPALEICNDGLESASLRGCEASGAIPSMEMKGPYIKRMILTDGIYGR